MLYFLYVIYEEQEQLLILYVIYDEQEQLLILGARSAESRGGVCEEFYGTRRTTDRCL